MAVAVVYFAGIPTRVMNAKPVARTAVVTAIWGPRIRPSGAGCPGRAGPCRYPAWPYRPGNAPAFPEGRTAVSSCVPPARQCAPVLHDRQSHSLPYPIRSLRGFSSSVPAFVRCPLPCVLARFPWFVAVRGCTSNADVKKGITRNA